MVQEGVSRTGIESHPQFSAFQEGRICDATNIDDGASYSGLRKSGSGEGRSQRGSCPSRGDIPATKVSNSGDSCVLGDGIGIPYLQSEAFGTARGGGRGAVTYGLAMAADGP